MLGGGALQISPPGSDQPVFTQPYAMAREVCGSNGRSHQETPGLLHRDARRRIPGTAITFTHPDQQLGMPELDLEQAPADQVHYPGQQDDDKMTKTIQIMVITKPGSRSCPI